MPRASLFLASRKNQKTPRVSEEAGAEAATWAPRTDVEHPATVKRFWEPAAPPRKYSCATRNIQASEVFAAGRYEAEAPEHREAKISYRLQGPPPHLPTASHWRNKR